VQPLEEAPPESNVVDLTELLKNSLHARGAARAAARRPAPKRRRA